MVSDGRLDSIAVQTRLNFKIHGCRLGQSLQIAACNQNHQRLLLKPNYVPRSSSSSSRRQYIRYYLAVIWKLFILSFHDSCDTTCFMRFGVCIDLSRLLAHVCEPQTDNNARLYMYKINFQIMRAFNTNGHSYNALININRGKCESGWKSAIN